MGDKVTIKDYKNSFNPIIFGEAKNPDSDYFYPKNLRKWKEIRLEELREIESFSSRFPLLKSYIIGLRNLGLKIGELFESIELKKNSTLILIKQDEILDQLKVIESYPSIIKKNIVSGEANLAYKLKMYCLDLFNEFLKNILNEEMGISIQESPLGTKFNRVQIELLDSVNLAEVKALEGRIKNGTTKTKDPSKYLWFKVGMLFVTGEIDHLMDEHDRNFRAVARSVDSNSGDSLRPYISESYNNSTDSEKNIFRNEKKIKILQDYCHKGQILICESFYKRIQR